MAEKNLKILLVDDTAVRMEMLRETLAECGFTEVICVCGSDDLLDRVTETNPDLVLIDVESPRRDTLEQLSLIQEAQPRPVVLFTQDQQVQSIEAAIRSGVSAYVTAGIGAAEVRPALDVAMATFRRFQALREEVQALQASAQENKLIQQAKGLVMQHQNLTEDQAYHLIRRTAMNRKVRLADLARQVIAAAKSKPV